MASPGSWLAFRRFFRISGFLYKQPWYWNEKEQRVVPRPLEQLGMWFFLNGGLIVICLTTFYLILSTILSSTKDPDWKPAMALLWAIVASATILTVVLSHTLIVQRKDVCWVINQLHAVTDSVIQKSAWDFKMNNRFNIDIAGLFLHIWLYAFLGGTSLGFIYPFVRTGEPTFWLLRPLNLPRLPNKVLRSVIQGFVFIHGIFVLLCALLTAAIYLMLTTNALKVLLRPLVEKKKWGNVQKLKLIQDAHTRFRRCRIIYKQLWIFNITANQIVYYFVPTALMIAMLLIITFATELILMYGHISHWIYGGAALMLIGTVFTIWGILPIGIKVLILSKDVIAFWNTNGIHLSKAERKEARSWRTLRVEVGPFFYCARFTFGTFMWHTVYNTITLVMSIKDNIIPRSK